MAYSKPVSAKLHHLLIVEKNTMSEPDAARHPSRPLEILDWAATQMGETIVGLVARFRDVGVQSAIMLLGKLGGGDHQFLRSGEGGAGRQRDLDHCSIAALMVAGDD